MKTRIALTVTLGIFIQLNSLAQTSAEQPTVSPPTSVQIRTNFNIGDLVSVESSRPVIMLRKARITDITSTNVTVETKTDAFIFDLSDVSITQVAPTPIDSGISVDATLSGAMPSTKAAKNVTDTTVDTPSDETPHIGLPVRAESSNSLASTSWIGGGYPAAFPKLGRNSTNVIRSKPQQRSKPGNAGSSQSILAVGQSNLGVGQSNLKVGQSNLGTGKSNLGIGQSNLGIGQPNTTISHP